MTSPTGAWPAITAGPARRQPGVVGGRRADRVPPRAGRAARAVDGGGHRSGAVLELPPGRPGSRWRADLAGLALRRRRAAAPPGCARSPTVVGRPAWSPDGEPDRVRQRRRAATIPRRPAATPVAVAPRARESPRWSPDGSALVYPAGGELRTVGGRRPARRSVSGAAGVTARRLAAVHRGRDRRLPSRSRRRTAPSTAAGDHAGRRSRSSSRCRRVPTRRGGRCRSLMVKPPDHGTVAAGATRPAAGFTGQDDADLPRQQRRRRSPSRPAHDLRRPRRRAPPPPPGRGPPAGGAAPFLTARATPRLDRRRRVLVRLACDQDCSLSVRLTARLRSRRR